MIKKIKMYNYKSFKEETIRFNSKRNILVGENGSGKSNVLLAIQMVLSGSIHLIERIGFESLFNSNTIAEFNSKPTKDKKYKELPSLLIELYFNSDFEENNFNINGKQNSDRVNESGLKLVIEPNELYSKEIITVLNEDRNVFPFDYYKINFETFSGSSYNSYNKKHKTRYELIDNTTISIDHSMKEFVSSLYKYKATEDIRKLISHKFKESTEAFSKEMYHEYGMEENENYSLKINSNNKNFTEQYLIAQKNNIDINDLGLGEKLLIAYDFAFSEKEEENKIILLEEPENHLSHINMKRLINLIQEENKHQIFISTHNNMITSRLELSNVTFLKDSKSTTLSDLSEDTERFFQKSPNTNLLNFLLSKKVILVEGDSEYILLNKFFELKYGENTEDNNIEIISCGGKTFKRYFELAQKLGIRVAVITDNDKDYEKNIIKNYNDIEEDSYIKIFSDKDKEKYTFEVCLYNENKKFYDDNLYNKRMTKGILNYMLDNKTESALKTLKLLETETFDYNIPKYILDAFKWIR